MTELYLIAHKVRGEPAFDIAARVQIGDEEGWIIPTSGHRAYPSDYVALDNLWSGPDDHVLTCLQLPGPDLEDHYPIVRASEAPKPSPRDLLAALGLARPKAPPIARRI